MIKLNGWKRIGIIASLAWILGGYIYAYDLAVSGPSAAISDLHVACDADLNGKTGAAYTNGFNECNRQAADSLASIITDAQLFGASVALIPVPLGWGFVYLVLFLVRWVRRGFMQGRGRRV